MASDQASDLLPHPLFWMVEKDGRTTYVLGTMHTGVDPETRIPKLVWDKLDSARAFAMETDLAAARNADFTRHDGGSLHRDLGDAYWAKLEAAFGDALATRLDHLKPVVPVAMLARRGVPETPAMDASLAVRAESEHKPVVFLEPVERQMTVLDKWMDVRALEEILDDLPGTEQRVRSMLDAYVAGDAARIEEITLSERTEFVRHGHTDAEFDQQLEDLIYSRNASWIEPLERLHAAGGGFVAVGAMHLVGKRNVLELLQQKGYKVTRLTPPT